MERAADVLVIGAGAFGLWTALAAARRGLSVAVVEAARVGAGASGGVLGALTPHRPGGWDALKAFQLEALLALGPAVAALEAETGVATGYRRTGRLVPLGDPAARARAEADAAEAAARWGGRARLSVLDRPGEAPGWGGALSPEGFATGAAFDTLSGSVEPRRLLAALRAAVAARGALREGVEVRAIDALRGRVEGPEGTLAAGHVVIAAGWRAAPLLAAAGAAEVRPVRGEAAVLAARLPEGMPVIHGRGVFVVRHGPERVAVGSTSAPGAEARDGDEAALDAVLAEAARLCPALAGAPVVERWQGVRPRPPGRMPVLGRLPGQERVWVASGGYKIGLGIAERAGAALAAALAGDADGPPIPAEFAPPPRG